MRARDLAFLCAFALPALAAAEPPSLQWSKRKLFHGPFEPRPLRWKWSPRPISVAGADLNWDLQLNIRNILDADKIVPLSVYYDGTPTSYSRGEPRSLILTSTFRF